MQGQVDSYLLAIDGLGFMIAPELLVRNDILAGKLVEPMKMKVAQPGGWYLAYQGRKRTDRRIQAFRKWIQDEIRA